MFSEDDLLPISALQHLLFCERQCALIHIERLWAENRLTVEGRQLHDKAHGVDRASRTRLAESRAGVRTVRALPLRSLRLGLAGVADVVEFHGVTVARAHDNTGAAADDDTRAPPGNHMRPGAPPANHAPPGVPFPIEYKRGRPKTANCDRVQLCAQALCLEEMLGVAVPAGALFYGRTRRRTDVRFDAALRGLTEQTAVRLHELVRGNCTPPAQPLPRCRNCSLRDLCMPQATTGAHSASGYIRRVLACQGGAGCEMSP